MQAIIQKAQGKEAIRQISSGIWEVNVGGQITEYRFTIDPTDAKRWMKEQGISWKRLKFDDMNKEKRILDMEFRVETRDDKRMVEGVAAVFNSLSEDLGGFREKIAPGAFDEVLTNDVRALINHDPSLLLARTKSGTLELFLADSGLGYRYTDPDTSYSQDLAKSMKRGDVTQSSFAFTIPEGGDTWEKEGDGWIRTINKVSRLFDVSPVTYPAYPDTTAAVRSMQSKEQEIEDEQTELQRKLQAQKDLVQMEQDMLKLALSGTNK